MTTSVARPRPVVTRRYRYSKIRWRVLVTLLDLLGAALMTLWRCLRRAPVVVSPRRILVAQLDHMGDAVLSSPLFPRLRAAYPEARIEVLASPSNLAVFLADPHVDEVILAERSWFERVPGRWAMLPAVWELGWSLRARRYDLGIDVRGDVLTVLVLALAGIPRRAGWAMGGGSFLLSDVASWIPGRHEVLSRLALLEQIGLKDVETPRVVVYPSDEDRVAVSRRLAEAWPESIARRRGGTRARRSLERTMPRSSPGRATTARPSLAAPEIHRDAPTRRFEREQSWEWNDPDWLHAGRFGEDAPLLVAHVGAGTLAKRWPRRHWHTLLAWLLRDGWRVVVVGGAEDADAVVDLPVHHRLRDWTGRLALTQTAALLERADLFVGADSGPAHLAACAGVPSVVLFSGTNQARQWRPWSRRSLVIRHKVSCRPCHQKVCPLADHPCMSGLTPDRVYRALRRWWERLDPLGVHHGSGF